MDVDPFFGTVTIGTFNLRLAGRREWTSGLILSKDASFSVASRATLNSEWHRDTERVLTKVNDALLPTRSLSSFASHFLSSIICSFCWRRVSCMCCRSLCHRRWASSLLLASTRTNSPSWYHRGIPGERRINMAESLNAFFSVAGFINIEHVAHNRVFLTPMLRRRGDLTGNARVFMESTGDWYSHGLARSGELAHNASFSCTQTHISQNMKSKACSLGWIIHRCYPVSLLYLNVQPDTERVPKAPRFHSWRLQ